MRNTIALFALLLVSACGGSDGNDSSTGTMSGDAAQTPSTPSTPNTPSAPTTAQTVGSADGSIDVAADAYAELDACRAGLSDADIAQSLMLAYDADTSIHELIGCGGLTVQVAIGLITGVVGMIVDDDDVMPAGLKFKGNGVYESHSTPGESSMAMTVRLYERVGDEDVLVEDDLFDRDNYLTGINVDANASGSVSFDINDPLGSKVSGDASVAIAYDEAGPWAKLLGLGDPPPNPIEVSDVADIHPDFGNIYVETEVEIHDVKGDSDIQLTVDTPRVRLVDFFDGGALDYQVVDFAATNAVLQQRLTMKRWNVSFVEHATLDGALDVSVQSSANTRVNYDASIAYDHSAYAAIDLACPE